jgi:subtilisin family serine protease
VSHEIPATNRLLVKMRTSSAMRATGSGVNLEPLYAGIQPPATAFGLDSGPQWFVAELPESEGSAWDTAHARVAAQLGIDDSDVVFAEPDIIHTIFQDGNEIPAGQAFAAGENCSQTEQDAANGKAVGAGFAWHLGPNCSQLEAARSNVPFADPRTRIAHVDTGYFASHVTVPKFINHQLERSFVEGDPNPNSAVNPGIHQLLLDNHDHGTGTLSILAGGVVPAFNAVLGGAPDAEVVPLRAAESVVLLRTSALARAIVYATQNRCDVITLSMGGLPSDAWAEAVDAAYDAGLCICAAAGNHTGVLPPKVLVYPARYPRVIAVCGVMADGQPYANLSGFTMEGSFGPPSVMKDAIAAYTPNIPWARFGCPDIVRLNGEGTSAATPQVAAAVALWFEKYKNVLPRNHERIEAVRRALFTKANNVDATHFGNGTLRANDALSVAPVLGLPKSPVSRNGFSFLRVVTGLGITDVPARERMFNVEITQRWLLNERLQALVPDPENTAHLAPAVMKQVMEEIIEDGGASIALRKHVAERYPVTAGTSAPRTPRSEDVIAQVFAACDVDPELTDPPHRRIRTYSLDPSLSTRLATAAINEVTLKVRWEDLQPGPSGEYIRVVDDDPSPRRYRPVDLNDPRLLAQDGWAPSEGNPQFHQQMVYAVAMKTIEYFESALGRPVLWRPENNPQNPFDDSRFVPQLVIRPHALRQANAFYSPDQIDLKFGYFEASADDPGDHMPGSRVYSCLSHDIIAHETTHAILDGMHRRFNQPTNIDVLAFHEAFADIVALLQHFTIPEVLIHEIALTRGNVETESLLGRLAIQFGYAMGGRAALRDAIGTVKDGVWTRFTPDPADLRKRVTPHARGAILVGAVFDAFIAIYNERIADLLRIYTGGTGVLQSGAIHPDLVHRLADEASRSATHVLTMCIRALDYLPPVDVTFFEYLRALITADFDIVSDDRHNYRVAFVEAFRRRGIYPLNADGAPRTFSVDTLRWQGLEQLSADTWKAVEKQYMGILRGLKKFANDCFYLGDRKELFDVTRHHRAGLHAQLEKAFEAVPDFAAQLGLDPKQKTFEVHELRRAMRISPDGSRTVPQLIVALTQQIDIPEDQTTGTPAFVFHGGSTLVVDLSAPKVVYRITKRIASTARQERTAEFARDAAADPLRALFFAPGRKEPFAALHALADQT